ncbi:MAG TPA: ferritin-like domain-containing protein [Pilimelia sp.]|nr:ferritin-like domain-containing protein [Pilimelia sp.]
MTLLVPEIERLDETSYRLFHRAQQRQPWSARELIGAGRTELMDDRLELAWTVASQGYYAEQAGLVAAAELAAETEDLPYRLCLATAVADEARHSDAFLAYAVARGGGLAACQDETQELHRRLSTAGYLEKCLLHTMLEGFAADEFVMLHRAFAGDPLSDIYRSVWGDEIRHVAIGLDYLRRSVADPRVREQWRGGFAEWERRGLEFVDVPVVSEWVGTLVGASPRRITTWFLRRHRARLRGAGLEVPDIEAERG